jgi:hypothetical protein
MSGGGRSEIGAAVEIRSAAVPWPWCGSAKRA